MRGTHACNVLEAEQRKASPGHLTIAAIVWLLLSLWVKQNVKRGYMEILKQIRRQGREEKKSRALRLL